jgi:hypothetical protein
MKRRNLIPLVLLLGMLITGATRSVAQDVQVNIALPYSGNFNNWTITFSTWERSYVFETDDDTFQSGILGTLPAGTYDVTFDSNYFSSEGFDFGIHTPSFSDWRVMHWSFTWYSVYVEPQTLITIDAGY